MERRTFLATLAGGLLAAPLAAGAEQAGRVYRIGFLGKFPFTPQGEYIRTAFIDGLRDHGYAEGKNLTIEYRFSLGRDERWPDLARELLQLGVEVIVTTDSAAVQSLKEHFGTVPVVMLGLSHPVEAGFVASLARPGGNITGLSNQLGDLNAKDLQLLREVTPQLSRLAVLWNPVNPGSALALKDLQDLARRETLKVQPVVGRTREEMESALAALKRDRPDALLVHPWYTGSPERMRIVEFAVRNRIPTITGSSVLAREGLLISYAPDFAGIFRRGSYYVDKILKGAKPADLPVEQPTKFDLVINLKTAKALGLTIPPSLLARADEVIQ